MKDSLRHYGIIGMRWGRRNGGSGSDGGGRKKLTTSQLSGAGDIASRSSAMTKEGVNITKSVSNIKAAKRKEDLSALSDDELKSKINRMNLEQQYSQLNSNNVSKGSEYARSALEITGSVLAIGGSAAAILVAAKQLKG